MKCKFIVVTPWVNGSLTATMTASLRRQQIVEFLRNILVVVSIPRRWTYAALSTFQTFLAHLREGRLSYEERWRKVYQSLVDVPVQLYFIYSFFKFGTFRFLDDLFRLSIRLGFLLFNPSLDVGVISHHRCLEHWKSLLSFWLDLPLFIYFVGKLPRRQQTCLFPLQPLCFSLFRVHQFIFVLGRLLDERLLFNLRILRFFFIPFFFVLLNSHGRALLSHSFRSLLHSISSAFDSLPEFDAVEDAVDEDEGQQDRKHDTEDYVELVLGMLELSNTLDIVWLAEVGVIWVVYATAVVRAESFGVRIENRVRHWGSLSQLASICLAFNHGLDIAVISSLKR